MSLFSTLPVHLYSLSVTLQGKFSAEITGLGTSIGEVGRQIIEDFAAIGSLSELMEAGVASASHLGLAVLTSPIMLIFCIIAMAYAVLKVFFANLKRGGILLIQIAVGSLYMFSIPRGYVDGFTQWMKQVIGLCLTAFLQSTILVAGLLAFRTPCCWDWASCSPPGRCPASRAPSASIRPHAQILCPPSTQLRRL